MGYLLVEGNIFTSKVFEGLPDRDGHTISVDDKAQTYQINSSSVVRPDPRLIVERKSQIWACSWTPISSEIQRRI
jgi:hypothetical protein